MCDRHICICAFETFVLKCFMEIAPAEDDDTNYNIVFIEKKYANVNVVGM